MPCGVNSPFDPGEFVAVVGRSGSGKSTLLAMLGGLCRPTSGTIAVDGVDLWSLSEPERAAFRNREVGLVFQFAGLLPNLRVVDNVAPPALVRGGITDKEAYRRATELLVRVGLSPSHGRLSFRARAANSAAAWRGPSSTRPRSCLRDAEASTSDLDEDTEAEILDALGEIHRRDGVTLVVVTHDAKIARRADRILEIRSGSIVTSRSSPPSETPGHTWAVVPNRDRAAEIPAAAPPAPAFEASARLGAGHGGWLLSVSAWVVPALLMALALNQGVALCQRHLLHQRREARAALEDAALLWLRADIEDVAYNGGASYTLTLSLKNLSAAKAVFVLSPTVHTYVQVGLTWQEIPTRSSDGQEGRVVRIGRRTHGCLRSEYPGCTNS